MAILGYVVFSVFSSPSAGDNDRKAVQLFEAQKSPEQRAAEARAATDAATSKAKKEAEFQRAVIVAKTIKNAMHNPASFEIVKLSKTPAGTLCFEYRGTNSFNAVIRNYAVVPLSGAPVTGSPDTVASMWNKLCADQPAEDMLHVRQAL